MRLPSVIGLVCCLSLASQPVSASSVLLGSGTLHIAEDLTIIESDGIVSEWLDLSTTDGMSISDAIATYAADGFHWATGTEVAELFSAFSITYASSPGIHATLDGTVQTQQTFIDYFGFTYSEFNPFGDQLAALGYIDDLTTETFKTWSCLSPGNGVCSSVTGFVLNTVRTSQSHNIGVFLVRDRIAVPEPSSAWQAAIGLVLMLSLVQRRYSYRHVEALNSNEPTSQTCG